MSLLLVTAQLDGASYIRNALAGRVVVTHYQQALKALDNLSEIQPALVVWSYNDFPRHWKTMVSALGFDSAVRFILVSDGPLPPEEDKKAKALLGIPVHTSGFFEESLVETILEHFSGTSPTPADHASLSGFRYVEPAGLSAGIFQEDRGLFSVTKLRLGPQAVQARLGNLEIREYPKVPGKAVLSLLLPGTRRILVDLDVWLETLDLEGQLSMEILRKSPDYLTHFFPAPR